MTAMRLDNLLDPYVLRARLQPPLVAVLPLSIAIVAVFSNELGKWGTVWGLIIASGGTGLIANITRDWGRHAQERLFSKWGGAPTTILLRLRNNPSKLVQRRRDSLSAILPKPLPTSEEELADPSAADEQYESAIAFLKEQTRDHKRFYLVFEENCTYGFRRNLFAIRIVGAIATVVAILIAGVSIGVSYRSGSPPTALMWIGLGLIVLFGAMQQLTARERWVRCAADIYADQLLAATDLLRAPTPKGPPKGRGGA